MTIRRSFLLACFVLSSLAIGAFVDPVTAQRTKQQQRRAAAAQPSTTFGFNVRVFGATGDGKTIDTPAIDKTIDAAAASGGGTVFFPAGSYLSVTVHLKSNVALYLDQGATIVAATTGPGVQYDPPEPNP